MSNTCNAHVIHMYSTFPNLLCPEWMTNLVDISFICMNW